MTTSANGPVGNGRRSSRPAPGRPVRGRPVSGRPRSVGGRSRSCPPPTPQLRSALAGFGALMLLAMSAAALGQRAHAGAAVPLALRVLSARRSAAGVLISLSAPVRRVPVPPLCGKDRVSFPAPAEVFVASSPYRCRATLRVTARDGGRAMVPVAVPAVSGVPLYAFASPANDAIYITVDDGWTP